MKIRFFAILAGILALSGGIAQAAGRYDLDLSSMSDSSIEELRRAIVLSRSSSGQRSLYSSLLDNVTATMDQRNIFGGGGYYDRGRRGGRRDPEQLTMSPIFNIGSGRVEAPYRSPNIWQQQNLRYQYMSPSVDQTRVQQRLDQRYYSAPRYDYRYEPRYYDRYDPRYYY